MNGGPHAIATISKVIGKQFVVNSSVAFRMFFMRKMVPAYIKNEIKVHMIWTIWILFNYVLSPKLPQ
jgi:hypothetical protein